MGLLETESKMGEGLVLEEVVDNARSRVGGFEDNRRAIGEASDHS